MSKGAKDLDVICAVAGVTELDGLEVVGIAVSGDCVASMGEEVGENLFVVGFMLVGTMVSLVVGCLVGLMVGKGDGRSVGTDVIGDGLMGLIVDGPFGKPLPLPPLSPTASCRLLLFHRLAAPFLACASTFVNPNKKWIRII